MIDTELARFSERPLTLLRRTLGTRKEIRGKVRRASHTLANYANPKRVAGRFERLQVLGYIGGGPNRTQFIFGSMDMFRFFIVPCAADYYRSKNITFAFHALLRFLDDPASMMDPTGFMSHRDAIIGHLMQVTHADPVYDLQLLAAIDDGLSELESQLLQIIDGTHPRAESIGAIIEDAEYHQRLLEHVREFMADPAHCKPLLRENVANNPHFGEIAGTFGDLPSAIGYFASLPDRPLPALRRLLRTRKFPRPQARAVEPAANDSERADGNAPHHVEGGQAA
ncbi:hypothetical protein DB30_01965 [Enhygromyxa salina]|uniref:Uncharacterized protein n=1 Tax=Enhygromyxa salina TaxID=215803 RepID=A0A0C2A3W6_9BACT|nr:hypothetical protein [Enhygromyxa salina]KIG18078.1 hypothetical protein DB30_01965 [Enhygromyxa salina]